MAIGKDRARKRAAGSIFALLALAVAWASFANPREYVPLQVTTAVGETGASPHLDQCYPSINNRGEIVYASFDEQRGTSLISTRRGELAGPDFGIEHPDINRLGEVVWTNIVGPGGRRTFSTTRGEIGFGEHPVISGNGLVATFTARAEGNLRLYSKDGTFVLLPLLGSLEYPVHVRNTGEVFYQALDAALISQLWSTKRGAMTHFAVPTAQDFAVNNRGEFVYAGVGNLRNMLFASDGTILWEDRATWPDMNNHGDIVFCEILCCEHGAHTQVLLLTRRPGAFRKDGFMRR